MFSYTKGSLVQNLAGNIGTQHLVFVVHTKSFLFRTDLFKVTWPMKCCCRWNWTWSFDVLSGCSRRSTPAAPTHPAVAGNWRSRCQQNRYHNSCQAASRNQASNISSEADGSCPHCTSCSCHQASVAGKVTTKSGSGRRGRQGQEIVKQWGDKKASNILLAERAWKQCNNDVFLKFGTMSCRCLTRF